MAVRVALGETQLVQEVRRFLIDNGVSLDAFSQVGALPSSAARATSMLGVEFQVGDVPTDLRIRLFKGDVYH